MPFDTENIPFFMPEFNGNEWNYVKACLDTTWVSSVGSFVDRFEQGTANYIGAKYAIATVNGTAALHIALLVAGVKPDDEVLVPALTFIASANAIRYVGGWPVFIDSEPEFWQMDPQKVADFLEKECMFRKGSLVNKSTGRRIKAMLPVHILGHPVDMEPIIEKAREYNLVVIEDACQSLGAKYKGRRTGNLSDIACFSFNGNKIITTGNGGMIVTDRADWARKAKYLTTQAKDDPLEYIHNELGYNYRLSNMPAAMGCAQLETIDQQIAAKRRIADTYTRAFLDLPAVTPMHEADWAFSTFWMYGILVNESICAGNGRLLLTELQKKGIQGRLFWRPIHRQKMFIKCQHYHIDHCERLYRQGVFLPSYTGLEQPAQNRVTEAIRQLTKI